MNYFPPKEVFELDNNKRYSTFPIIYPNLYEAYKKQEANFWTDEEISADLINDRKHRNEASKGERKMFDYVQSFFAISDGVVNETITGRILMRVKNMEYRMILIYQAMMEQIHGITYSKIIDAAVEDSRERADLFDAAKKDPSIKRLIDWIHKWTGYENDLHYLEENSIKAIQQLVNSYNDILKSVHPGENIEKYKSTDIRLLETKLKNSVPPLSRLIAANAIMEGVTFQGKFAVLFWFAKNGKFPGATKANQKISEDEGQHASVAAMIYRKYIKHKLSPEEIYQMLDEIVAIEIEGTVAALPKGLLGINSELLSQYIKFSSD